METPVKTIAPNTLHICSAAEALALLRKHGGHGSAAFMRSLADAVSDENNHVTGTVGDFNNLIDRFEVLGDYFDALRVCDFALKIYPRSATLLAITLNTCARSGADGEKYLAAAVGIFDKKSGIIDRNIRRIPGIATIKREVCDGDGKRAVTEYKILKEQNGLSLAEIILHTGRTHQIRVHFAAEGHPLFGDWLYGKETAEIGRPALHCAEITFLHPDTKEKLCFTAPLPDDIKSLFS